MADKITTKDLADKKGDFVLIDVREADEVAEDGDGGTIEEAVNMPLGQLIRSARQGGLDDLKGKTIWTYCNVGYRVIIGADEPNNEGFTNVTLMAAMQLGKRRKRRIRNDLYL